MEEIKGFLINNWGQRYKFLKWVTLVDKRLIKFEKE